MLNEEILNENDLIIEQIEEQNIINYYLFIENDSINGCGMCKRLDENVINFEVSEEIYNNFEKYIYKDGEIVLNPNYEQEQEEQKKEQFKKDFFNTSLGWVRRKVSMATGETKDFLSDLLPTISMGVSMGQPVTIITYKEPDFSLEVIDWESLQEYKTVTTDFIQECFLQLSNDFKV